MSPLKDVLWTSKREDIIQHRQKSVCSLMIPFKKKNGGGGPDSTGSLPQYVGAPHRGQGVAVQEERAGGRACRPGDQTVLPRVHERELGVC